MHLTITITSTTLSHSYTHIERNRNNTTKLNQYFFLQLNAMMTSSTGKQFSNKRKWKEFGMNEENKTIHKAHSNHLFSIRFKIANKLAVRTINYSNLRHFQSHIQSNIFFIWLNYFVIKRNWMILAISHFCAPIFLYR